MFISEELKKKVEAELGKIDVNSSSQISIGQTHVLIKKGSPEQENHINKMIFGEWDKEGAVYLLYSV